MTNAGHQTPAYGESGAPQDRLSLRTARLRRWSTILAFPVLVMVAVTVLAALNLNGSSIALNSRLGASDPDIVAGTPRVIRGDEFALATPVDIGNARRNFPAHAWIGLTNTDMDVAGQSAPTLSITTPFVPVNFPYFATGVERAFAARWWLVAAVGLIGTYFLLLVLRRKPLLAAVMASVVGFAPIIAWWSNSPGLVIGYLALASAARLYALRIRSPLAAVGLALVAAYCLCAAFLVLYPPWLVSVGLVMAALVVGDVIARRPSLLRLALVGAFGLLPTLAFLGVWLRQSSVAIASMAATIYPGNRVSESGKGLASVLLSSGLNGVLSRSPQDIKVIPGAEFQLNESEMSAPWFSLPLLILLVTLVSVVVVHRMRASHAPDAAEHDAADESSPSGGPDENSLRSWAPFIAVTAVLVLELLWMLVPLPAFIGRITLLNRVPGGRMPLALGVAAALLIYLAAGRVRGGRPAVVALLTAVTAGLAALLTWWSASQLLVPGTQGIAAGMAMAAAVTGCLTLMCFSQRSWPAVVVLLIVVGYNYAIVNPLYRGLGPLTHSPLAVAAAAIQRSEGPTKWIDTAGVGSASVVAASGNELLSGMTVYPTRSVWERLAPMQEDQWNNFAKYIWVNDPTADPAVISPVRATLNRLRINLCSPKVDFLGIRYLVSSPTTVPRCFVPVATVRGQGSRLVISRRS